MGTFQSKIKSQCKVWNEKNPKENPKNIKSLAEEIGTSSQYISQIGTRFQSEFNKHMEIVFLSKEKNRIRKVWKTYSELNIKVLQVLEKIRVSLECEIWDLIEKIEE